MRRVKFYEVMQDKKIHLKLIKSTKKAVGFTKLKTKHENVVSESFEFIKGVKKGDSLSATHFIIALHYGVKDIDQRRTIQYNIRQVMLTLTCAYAADVVIIARSR